jgi:hypothetical protein
MESKIKATEEQRAYAWLLDWGMKIGLVMLIITFGMYLAGVMKPYVPVEDLVSGGWSLRLHGTAKAAHGTEAAKAGHGAEAPKEAAAPAAPAKQEKDAEGYLEKFHIQPGWWWLGQIGKGDFANFIGIAFLAGVTIVCYMRILPILTAKKDWIYSVFALLEILVLSLAASGLLKSGH